MNFKILCLISFCVIDYIFALSFGPCNKSQCKKIECCASGELTLDMRNCCLECARTDQEPCGDHFGATWECASGLSCLRKLECKTQKGENCIFPCPGRWCPAHVQRSGSCRNGLCTTTGILIPFGHCKLGRYGRCIGMDWHSLESPAKPICVNKKQIEDQLKANKSIAYFFRKISSQKKKKKIKRCNTESAHLAGTGKCKNRNSRCGSYKRKGYCTKRYVSWMARNCKKSCNKCKSSSVSGSRGKCKNRSSSCGSYKRKGYCTGRYASWMSRNCQKSCNKCNSKKE